MNVTLEASVRCPTCHQPAASDDEQAVTSQRAVLSCRKCGKVARWAEWLAIHAVVLIRR
jgi:endogenous inhibitor of DNA gyrase (YacG/DUF329 family)